MSKKNDKILDISGLEALEKILATGKIKIKVGIMGKKDNRSEDSVGSSNAGIGLVHEFGSVSRNIPERSFLRMPLANHLYDNLKKSGLDKDTFKQVLKDKSFKEFASKVAVAAEATVLEAFDTGGFGQWPAWQNDKYENNTGMILNDTQQLRNSITAVVEDD